MAVAAAMCALDPKHALEINPVNGRKGRETGRSAGAGGDRFIRAMQKAKSATLAASGDRNNRLTRRYLVIAY